MENYLEKEFYELIKKDKSVFEFIQQKSIDGLWYLDLENPENEWVSDKFWTELGYAPNEMKAKSNEWKNHIFPEDLELVENAIDKHTKDLNTPYDVIVRYKHKNGSTVYIHSKGLSIIDKNGKPNRVLGVRNNITTAMQYKIAKQNNEKLSSLNKKLQEQNDTLKEFSYLTSHDLQEPLNTIISYLSLLDDKKENMDEMSKLSISVIEKSAFRMKDFITSLLNYIVIGNEREKEEFFISEIFESIQESLEALIFDKKATVVLDFKDFKVKTFKNDLNRLIFNLMENGLKYSKENVNPFIKITITKDDANYIFSFQDNGIGIEEQYNNLIFKVFKRLHSKDEIKGTGIGLAECKKIVDLYQGKIWVKSSLGQGSTFYFSIPKAEFKVDSF